MSPLNQAERLHELARHLRGRLIGPQHPDWQEARSPWNRRVDQRPLAVVDPADASDIAATAAFAARNGVQVTVQSSGHGAGDTLDNTILIRTRGLRDITLDPARGRVRIGAGVRCSDLLAAGGPHGLALSTGSAADAGAAGYAIFGGVGYLGRTLGFTAHHVLAADVVTADGSALRADEDSHPDLLWALRGGGGGFALVTHLELRLARLPGLFGGQLIWPQEAAADVFGAWRAWARELPREMTSNMSLVEVPPLPEIPEMLRGRRVAAAAVCYTGAADEGAALLQPLTRAAAPLADTCRPMSSTDLPALQGAPAAPMPMRIRSALLNHLPEEAVGELIRRIGPGSQSPLMLTDIRRLGGAYAEPGDGYTEGAIGRTDAEFLIELVALAPGPEADTRARAYQQDVLAALSPWAAGTILPSFADPGTAADQVFSEATRRRLAEVKSRYDPAGTIRSSFPLTPSQQPS